MADKRYYLPTEQGEEAELGRKLDGIRRWKEDHRAAK
jgi:hypothetical protein